MTEITKMEMGAILRRQLEESGPDQHREMAQMCAEALIGRGANLTSEPTRTSEPANERTYRG